MKNSIIKRLSALFAVVTLFLGVLTPINAADYGKQTQAAPSKATSATIVYHYYNSDGDRDSSTVTLAVGATVDGFTVPSAYPNSLTFKGWATSAKSIEVLSKLPVAASGTTDYYAVYVADAHYYFLQPTSSDITSGKASDYMYMGDGSVLLPWEYDFTTNTRWYAGTDEDSHDIASMIISEPTSAQVWEGIHSIDQYKDVSANDSSYSYVLAVYSQASPSVSYNGKSFDYDPTIHIDVNMTIQTKETVTFGYTVTGAPGGTIIYSHNHFITDGDGNYNIVAINSTVDLSDGLPFETDEKEYASAITSGTEKYVFDGWYEDEACTIKAKDSYDTSTKRQFFGRYNQIHTLTYDANGGTLPAGITNPQTHAENSEVTLIADPTRDGYTFTGWNDSKDGSGKDYATSFKMPDNDLTLYAQWEKIPTYTVTYSWTGYLDKVTEKGYTLPTTVSYKENDHYTVDSASKYLDFDYTVDGVVFGTYSFSGWKLNGEGEVVSGTSQTMGASNVEYKGVWTYTASETYKVTYSWEGADENVLAHNYVLPTDNNEYVKGQSYNVKEPGATTFNLTNDDGSIKGIYSF